MADSLGLLALDLTIQIPSGFLEVLNNIVFLTGSPDVLDSVAEIEVHMLHDCDAFDPRGMIFVVLRIDRWVRRFIDIHLERSTLKTRPLIFPHRVMMTGFSHQLSFGSIGVGVPPVAGFS